MHMTQRRYLLLAFVIPTVFLGSVLATSRLYWGYWIAPPSSVGTARALSEVTSFTSFWWRTAPVSGRAALLGGAKDVNYVSGDSPYGRLPAALVGRHLLPTSEHPVDPAVLHSLIAALSTCGLLRRGEPGYEYATDLHGHIATGKDRSGRPVYVAALVGGQVSNDHYPYYELIATPLPTGQVKLQHVRFYWYDFAGMEGIAHWFAGLAVASMATAIWLVVGFWRALRPKRDRAA